MATTVPCGQCEGRGHRELTRIERETLDAIGDDWRSTADICDRLTMVSGTALLNRLNALRVLELVDRRNLSGSHYEWKVRQ